MTRYPGELLGMAVAMFLGMGLAAPAEEGGHGMATHAEGRAEHLHKNHFAIFLGSTQAEEHHGERDDPGFTLGFDYERRFNKYLGAGVLLDWVAEGTREILIGVPVFVHVWKGATVQLAPGWQGEREKGENWFAFRAGLTYEFDVGGGTLAPAVFYDRTEDYGLWVIGVNVGKGW